MCEDNRCGFLAHCSKVAYNHTFKLNKWYEEDTCAKVLDNMSTNYKFVSRYALDKMMTYVMKVTDIMLDLRKNHSVGVSFHTTWMAKKEG